MPRGEAMKLCILTVLLSVLIAGAAVGQTYFGSVVGYVTDASNSAIPEANVTMANNGTMARRTTSTDNSGAYQFLNLPPGQYRAEIEKTGFRRLVREPIIVEVQSAVRIDVNMQLGDVNQVVEVVAQTPLLQTWNASLGQVVEARKVLEMPL